MSNGKGSRPRNTHPESFRANFEAITWRRQAETTSEASKPRKSQGNGLEKAITGKDKQP